MDIATLAILAGQGAFQGASGAAYYVALGFLSSRAADPESPQPFDYVQAAETIALGAVFGAVAGVEGLPTPADGQAFLKQSGMLSFVTMAVDKGVKALVRHIKAYFLKHPVAPQKAA